MYRPINELTLHDNEWLEIDQESSQVPPFRPVKFNQSESQAIQLHEDSEEEFTWFQADEHTNTTYFNMVNKTRRTVEAGDQLFYCYGNRSNKFLLINYGFCFPNNLYDSFEFHLRLDVPIVDKFVPELIDLECKMKKIQKIRLKRDQICEVLLSFLRSFCKKSFLVLQIKKDAKAGNLKSDYTRRVLITRPTILAFEQYVMTFYLQICTYI